jgi:L-malate glycosyltransferase
LVVYLFMKLLFIGDGRSIHVYRWVDYLQKKGHEILLLTDYPGTFSDIQQHVIGNKKGNKLLHYFQCVRDIKDEIKSFKPDILHAHFISGYGYWAQMSQFHPLVLTAWGSDIYITPYKKIISKRLTRKALTQADLVTVDSMDLKSAVLKLAPQTKKIELIIFGVDTTMFKPADKPAGRKVILSNRRLEPIYNIENIIRATSLMKREFPDIQLIILGDGSQKENLKQLSNSLGLQSNVEFKGEVKHEELVSYLQTADVYISVPLSDGTSVSLLEAMACEKPVVVSDLPSNREWIEQDVNGKLVLPDSVDVLARSTLELLRDPNSAQTMGRKNRQIILNRAEFNSQMQKMEKLYTELL